MEYQRLTNEEAELLFPPPARWIRYQGRERLRYPDAVRQAVNRAAASAWEHIPPIFRPVIRDRLDALWLKAGQCTRWETLGPRIVLVVNDDSCLPELYPWLRYAVAHLMTYALLVEIAANAAGADRRAGATPSLWQGAAAALGSLVLQGGAGTSAMAKALLAVWGLHDPGEIRPRRGQAV
jgi:hypothetical protein